MRKSAFRLISLAEDTQFCVCRDDWQPSGSSKPRGMRLAVDSVGVMMFEALTGQQPFRGSICEIVESKLSLDAPAPMDLASGVPPDPTLSVAGCSCAIPRTGPVKRKSYGVWGAIVSAK